MKFVAIDKNRSAGDADGKGWALGSKAKQFDETTTIEEVWRWYVGHTNNGILEIMPLEEA